MKGKLSPSLFAACLLSISIVFSSCLKDNCRRSYKIYTPVYKNLSALRASVQSTAAIPVTNTGKMFIKDNWIFLNEQNKGIHIIDNSNPAHPVKTSFINIPGNIDMYAKGDILIKKYLTKTFPDKAVYTNSSNPDSINVITGYTSRDTTVDCTVQASVLYYNSLSSSTVSGLSQNKANTGMAGSMARFAAVNNYMYTVSTNSLNVIDINDAANPLFVQNKNIGWSIETIFPYNNKLYIGAGSSMSVYDLQDPVNPQRLSWTGHWCSGDPVVADDNYAYVTLHEANVCGSTVNQLEIYSLNNPTTPTLVKTYALTNPQGLSKDGNLLFICDGKDGLKIYDITSAIAIKLIKHLPGSETYDVIAANGIAYVVAKEGLYQYDYSNPQDIHLLSKLLK
jgi:hypothetical protein